MGRQAEEFPIVELKLSGTAADDSARVAAALAAHVHAQQSRTFRQLLWRRLETPAAPWLILGVLHVVPAGGTAVGLTLLLAVGGWAMAIERRAGHRAGALVDAAVGHHAG